MYQQKTVVSKRLSSEQRRDLLLQVTEELICTQGISATSLDAIIKRAGGSKRSIYKEFGNKEQLILELLRSKVKALLQAMSFSLDQSLTLQESLMMYSERFLGVQMTPSFMGVFSALQQDAKQYPEVIEEFLEMGPKVILQQLVVILDFAKQKKEIADINTEVAASLFLGMLRGNLLYIEAQLKGLEHIQPTQIHEHIHWAVHIFLKGIVTKHDD